MKLITSQKPINKRLLIGIPTTGIIRYEWHASIQSLIIPTNWTVSSMVQFVTSTLGFAVAEARNLIVQSFLNGPAEWLFFIDHDVLCLPNTFIWINEHLLNPKSPVIGGLYYTKAHPAEPLVYRGRGNGPYRDFKLGDLIWCDGLGMGFTLIHRSVLETLWYHSEQYTPQGSSRTCRRVFVSPRATFFDPETNGWAREVGTEDLYFLERIKQEGVLEKTPWKHLSRRKYPFLVDTRMFLYHIDLNGVKYPLPPDLPKGFMEWEKRLRSQKWASVGV